MRQVLLELRVLRGRREEKLRRPGAGLLQRLDDRHQNFQELMQKRPDARWGADGHHVPCREGEHGLLVRELEHAAGTAAFGEATVPINSGTGASALELTDDREPVVVRKIALAATGSGTELESGIEQQVMAYNERTWMRMEGTVGEEGTGTDGAGDCGVSLRDQAPSTSLCLWVVGEGVYAERW